MICYNYSGRTEHVFLHKHNVYPTHIIFMYYWYYFDATYTIRAIHMLHILGFDYQYATHQLFAIYMLSKCDIFATYILPVRYIHAIYMPHNKSYL